jgi:hypothetical protein
VRDRDQGDVVVPAHPAAPLEVVQPKCTFEFAIVLLHSPTQPGQTDQLHDRCRLGQARQPVLGRLGLADRPLDQQPAHRQLAAVLACQPAWGDPGRAHPQRQEPAALQALAAPPPDQLDAGLLPGRGGQLGERGRRLPVARPGTAALARVRRSGGVHML